MSQKKVSCSVKELKKNERRGTMEECAEKKQVRYWGVKKVDNIVLGKLTGKSKKKKYSLPEIQGKLAGLKTKHSKLLKKIEDKNEKGETTKTLKKDLEKIAKDYKKLIPTYKQLLKEENDAKKKSTSKKTSKK